MFAIKDGQRLYLTSWQYNCARVMTQLAKLVEAKGGKVKYDYTLLVSNRSINEKIREIESLIEGMRKVGEKLNKELDLSKIEAELAALKAIPNEPITVTQDLYIVFVLNDVYYYYEADDNPFFEFRYIKTPVVNGKYSSRACLDEMDKSWTRDEMFGLECPEEVVNSAAEALFDMLIKAEPSVKRLETTKRRVPNMYNDGYHYETVYEKETFRDIDF